MSTNPPLAYTLAETIVGGETTNATYLRALIDNTLTPHAISIFRDYTGEPVAAAMARVLHPLDDEHVPGEESLLEFVLRADVKEVASHLGKLIAHMPKNQQRQDLELLGSNLADVKRALAHPWLREDLDAARAIYGFDPIQSAYTVDASAPVQH